ncbi:MAG: mevalonate kinase [Anaerolineales bacterium]
MIRTSAPGKIILFGEHAVVYGRPALAVPVTQVHADVEAHVESTMGGDDWTTRILIDAPDIGLFSTLHVLQTEHMPHALAAVIEATRHALGLDALPPMRLRVTSSIPVASGLGSGAAVSVALIRAVAGTAGRALSDEQVNAIAYEVEKLHHGTPSGIDNTVITYARPVYFVRGRPIETFSVGAPFTILIGDTGIAAPTRESVGDVRKLWEADKPRWEAVFDQVGEIVRQAREAIENGQVSALGPLMNANHTLLQEMTVSCPELDHLVEAARLAGALGAKLSGGGRGGNMIALAEKEKMSTVADALHHAGAKRVIVTEVR